MVLACQLHSLMHASKSTFPLPADTVLHASCGTSLSMCSDYTQGPEQSPFIFAMSTTPACAHVKHCLCCTH